MQRRVEYPTAYCPECDLSLAADMAALPPESRAKIIATVHRLVEFHARKIGITLPSEREAPPEKSNVVLLRISPHT